MRGQVTSDGLYPLNQTVGFLSSDSKVLKIFKLEAKPLAQTLFTQKVRCVYRKLLLFFFLFLFFCLLGPYPQQHVFSWILVRFINR